MMIAWILPGRDLCDTRASVVATDEGSTQAPLGNVQSNEDLIKILVGPSNSLPLHRSRKAENFFQKMGIEFMERYFSVHKPIPTLGGRTNKQRLTLDSYQRSRSQ